MAAALILYFGPNIGPIVWATLNVMYAMTAGALGYLSRSYSPDSAAQFNFNQMLIETAASGFVGFLAFLICQIRHLDGAALGLIVGFFGWIGSKPSIVVLEKIVFKLLGVFKHDSNGS